MDDFITANDELEGLDALCHHGIKGMKWGVRRTPAQLGHRIRKKKNAAQKLVEDAWKKHKAKSAEKKANKEAVKKAEAVKKKSLSELTDEELKRRIERGRLEREALTLERDISNLSPKKTNEGKAIFKKFLDNSIVPAATEAGKKYLSKLLEDKLGVSEKKQKSIKDLAEEAKNRYELEKYKKDLDDLKNPKNTSPTIKDLADKAKDQYNYANYTKKIKDLQREAQQASEERRAAAVKAAEEYLNQPRILALPAPKDD